MVDVIATPPRLAGINRYPFRPGEVIPPSWSASLHLVLVIAGHGRFILDGNPQDLAPGMVAALPWGRAWSFTAAARDPLAIISLHLRFLPWDDPEPAWPAHGLVGRGTPPPCPDPQPMLPPVARPADPAHLRQLAEAALDSWHGAGPQRVPALRGLALAFIAALPPRVATGRPHPQAGRIAALLDWLAFHPGLFPQRSELEARAGLGRTAFGAAFRAATGLSPAAWLQRRRLAAAHRLLTTTRTAVAAVAAQVGFADPFHFSRCFRARYGRSPRQVRSASW